MTTTSKNKILYFIIKFRRCLDLVNPPNCLKTFLRANAQKYRAKCKNSDHGRKWIQSYFSICNEELTGFQRFRRFFIKIRLDFRKLIFALSLAIDSRKISLNWHSRLSLRVSSKASIIGKKETIFLKKSCIWHFIYACFSVVDDVSCYEKTRSLMWFHHSFYFIITNRLIDMWPLFNRARFFAYSL